MASRMSSPSAVKASEAVSGGGKFGVRVLILEDDHEIYAGLLREDLPPLIASQSVEAVIPSARSCDIWFGQPDLLVQLLRAVPPPKWIQSTWAGFERFLAPDLPRGYLLTRAVGVFGQSMAEYVLSYMLARERQHGARLVSQKSGIWDDRLPGGLAGRTVLIAGCGDIGQSVARFLVPFGCTLLGVARTARRIEPFEEVGTIDRLPELAARADYVVNLLPDGARTRDLFDSGLFRHFKFGATFINAGRGSAVVEEDLGAAVRSSRVSWAVLDVCREEPLDPKSPLWSLEGVFLTGHTAAPSTPASLVRLFRSNLERFRAGEALEGVVDLSVAGSGS